MPTLLFALVLIGLGPIALPAAQQAPLEQRLGPATYQALRPVFEAARADSLPLRALEAKALEGVSKRKPPAQIVAVVRQLAADLKRVRALLRDAAPQHAITDVEIVAADAALRQQVPPEDVAALWRNAPAGTPLEIPFAVLGELVQRGVPTGDARRVIEHLVSSGVPQERMIEIPQRIDVALGVGALPMAALGSALQSLGIPAPPVGPGVPRPGRPRVPNP
jgi:hypothetical protein